MAAPMPRAAPVTTTTRPSNGRRGQLRAASFDGPTRHVCPLTKAERPSSRKDSVEARSAARRCRSGRTPGSTWRRPAAPCATVRLMPSMPWATALASRPLDVAGVGGQDDHPPGALQGAHRRPQHLPQPLQLGDLPHAGGVHHDGPGPRRVARRHVATLLVLASASPARRAAPRRGRRPAAPASTRPGPRRRASPSTTGPGGMHAPAAQHRRVGQAGLPGHELARRAVAYSFSSTLHHHASRIATTPWPPAAQIDTSPRRARARARAASSPATRRCGRRWPRRGDPPPATSR